MHLQITTLGVLEYHCATTDNNSGSIRVSVCNYRQQLREYQSITVQLQVATDTTLGVHDCATTDNNSGSIRISLCNYR